MPTPTKTRPGARFAIVANAWASTEGWKRSVGVDTLVPIRTRVVVAASAPSHGRAAGAWPPVWRNGWKWSETATLSNPASSAKPRVGEQLGRGELLRGGLVADLEHGPRV